MSLPAMSIKTNVPVYNVGSFPMTDNIQSPGSYPMTENIPAPRQAGPSEYPAMAPLRTTNQPTSFRSTHQAGFLSILYAIGQTPLSLWEKQVRSGYVKRINDADISTLCIEILGGNIGTTFITTPIVPQDVLGIRLPILVLILKNIRRFFMFQVQILDDTGTRRRFRVSTFHATPDFGPFSATIPLKLEDGWNQVSMNLAEITRKVYGTEYKETLRLQIHSNCRLRRVYFADRSYSEDDVHEEFSLLLIAAAKKEEEAGKEGTETTMTN